MINPARRTAILAGLLAGTLTTILACGGITVDPDTPTPKVTVAVSGVGSGRVTSSDSKLDCKVTASVISGPTCSATYDSGTVVTLSASADTDQEFKAWSGDCAGTTTCRLTLSRSVSASAAFVRAIETLSLELVIPASAADGAAIIRIDGPSVLGIVGTAGLEIASRPAGTTAVTSRTIMVRGNLTTGVVARVNIRGVDAGSSGYSATVLSVAGRQSAGYVQRQGLAAYQATVKP